MATPAKDRYSPKLSLGEASPEHFEGDYHAPSAAPDASPRVEPLPLDFLLNLAEALNTTLDLDTLMRRVADLVRAVIDYRIFGILLINDRTQDLWMRFQIGHTQEAERSRVKSGYGVVGQAALQRKSILVEDVADFPHYIPANPGVRSELAVPLIIKNRVIGVLDIESEQLGFFTVDHQRLLELVASRMAVAVENARLYTRISRQAQTLTVLNEISREISSLLDPDDILERVGLLLKRVIDFQMFTILLWNERTQQYEHRFSTKYGERVIRERNIKIGQGIIGMAAKSKHSIITPDVRKEPLYIVVNPETRSKITAPLIYKGTVIGLIDLEHTRVNYYNGEHEKTLTTLASQLAISLANARLYQRIHEEEQRLERDLQMARQVQLRLMPSTAPVMQRAQIAARFSPARSIGGDLYDFLDSGPGKVGIALGDVSGKAAPAALYAALVSGILRSLTPQRLSPAALLAALNDQLQERKLEEQYVTMLIAVWDDENQTLRVANAGSVQPLFVTCVNGVRKVRTIKAEGFPLGLFPHATYEEFTLSTQPGDQLIFFSDGIVDAVNPEQEMFGDDRLKEILTEPLPLEDDPAGVTADAVLNAVAIFQDGAEHFDDETVVVLHAL